MADDSPLLTSYTPLPIELEYAEGCELIAKDGKRYLDLYGGHCVCLLGHNSPVVKDAITRQMERITFYSAALALPERDAAARALLDIFPDEFGKVFFVNSGAEANENALKFALAHTKRKVVVTIEGAFHGRSASVDPLCGGPDREAHYPQAPFDVRWVGFNDVDALAQALGKGDVAAVMIEPVQSMAGCKTHSKEFIATLNELAAKHDTLIIADEIQGGFARCTEMWSFQAVGLKPDLITCAKGLGAGFPVGALISKTSFGQPGKGLFGSTFGGGPLASAVSKVVCEALKDPALSENVRKIDEVFTRLKDIDGVKELQGLGLLRGVRLAKPAAEVKAALIEKGFIVGASNDPEVIRLMPPLTLSVEQAESFNKALAEVL